MWLARAGSACEVFSFTLQLMAMVTLILFYAIGWHDPSTVYFGHFCHHTYFNGKELLCRSAR